jgi:hypothetical protein
MRYFKATDPWGTYFWRITDDGDIQIQAADGSFSTQRIIRAESALRDQYTGEGRTIDEITEDQVGK